MLNPDQPPLSDEQFAAANAVTPDVVPDQEAVVTVGEYAIAAPAPTQGVPVEGLPIAAVVEGAEDVQTTLGDRVSGFFSRLGARYDEWADRMIDRDPRLNKAQLATVVGVAGGIALYFAAPAAAHQVMETIQTQGNNFANPGVNQASIGEFTSVAAAGGVASLAHLHWLRNRRAAQQFQPK